jgi:hypothetical protein
MTLFWLSRSRSSQQTRPSASKRGDAQQGQGQQQGLEPVDPDVRIHGAFLLPFARTN